MIATASLCLGLVYIASVFLYLHIKKRKSLNRAANGKDDYNTYQQNDQVTFGAGISRSVFGGQSRSSILSRSLNGSQRGPAGTAGPPGLNLHSEEMGVIKSNPLLKHYPGLQQMASDGSGFVSDTSNSNSEFDDDFSITQDSTSGSNVSGHHSSYWMRMNVSPPPSVRSRCWVCNVFSILLTEQNTGYRPSAFVQ